MSLATIRTALLSRASFKYALYIFAFTLPLSRAAVSFFEIYFILILLLQTDKSRLKEQLLRSPALIAIALFVGFELFTIIYSSNWQHALAIYKNYSFWLVIFIIALRTKKEWIEPAISLFLYAMLISEVLAYLIYFDIYAFNGLPPSYPSPFMMHIDYSIFLAFTAMLLLNRIFSTHYSRYEKLFMVLFFMTVTTNLFISNGRTGQLAFVVALLVATLYHFRFSIKSLLLFSLLSISIVTVAYNTLPLFKQRADAALVDITKFQKGNYDSSWGLRAAFWVISGDILSHDPLLGIGIGDYMDEANATLQRNDHGFNAHVKQWCSSNHFHNQYLMIAVQSGLIGLALMLYMFYRLFTLAIDNRELKILSALFFTIYSVGFMAEPLWVKQFPLALFVLFTSLFIAAATQKEPS